MKIKKTYCLYKGNTKALTCATLLFLVTLIGCNNKEQKSTTLQHSSMAMDSTMKNHAGMVMSHEQIDTTVTQNYWNTLSVNRTVIAKQKAIPPVIADMNFTFNGNGYITFDMRRNRKVAVRVGGRIERLYVKYNYQYVRKGEKILELYSSELNTYLDEYLYVQERTTDTNLMRSAKQKLLLLGFTQQQLKQIDQGGQTSLTVPIYSPYEGYVLFNPSVSSGMSPNENNDGSGNMGGMSKTLASSATTTSSLPNTIREGMYVNKDQTLFWINDFKEVWGIIAFTKENEKYIRKGQTLVVTSELLPGQSMRTSVQLIEQVYQQGQKFTQVRIYLPNSSGRLKENSLVTAVVSVPVKSLMVPASSVYYLGHTSIVWVKIGTTKEGSNIFQSRVVKTGHQSENKVEILDGLNQSELVAQDAGYLADSESIINY